MTSEHIQQKTAALAKVINSLPAEIEILHSVDPTIGPYLIQLLREAGQTAKDLCEDHP